MKKQEWINFIITFPSKNRGDWEVDLLPQLAIAKDSDYGMALGIGWLFWTLIIYFSKWE